MGLSMHYDLGMKDCTIFCYHCLLYGRCNLSLYVHETQARIMFITIYVDDFNVLGNNDVEIENVKGLLKRQFEVKI